MPARIVSRSTESRAVADFLAGAPNAASALVLEGEAGIGKTTMWLDVLEQARDRGFRVLTARAAAAETVLAYASLADMLRGVDPAIWADLPEPQQVAVDRVLLRAPADGRPTDQHAVAAGFLSVIEELANDEPVLLAIDDLQWLDPSSASAMAFAARRFSTPVGVLVTVRADPNRDISTWLQLPRSDAIKRIRIRPMSLGQLHRVVSQRLGQSFPRPAMVRIHEVSGGNPFYAIELARIAVDARSMRADAPLPGTLAELMRARLETVDARVHDVLLAAACTAAPTVELLAVAVESEPDQVVELLEEAEHNGILVLDGGQVRFAHPLLGRGVYTGAAPARRREMHRRLAEAVDEPELHARHLALATVRGDPTTLASLDAAAEMARVRGAPAAAAELLDLAIGLGGDTPERRIRCATHHFDAGDPARARAILEETIKRVGPGTVRAEALSALALVSSLNDNFFEAAEHLERALVDADEDVGLRVSILVPLTFALFNSGQFPAAVQRAEQAVTAAESLGESHLLSQALSMRAMVHFLRGDGVDEENLQRAVELEDPTADVPAAFSPTVHKAMLLACTSQLEEARQDWLSIRRRCIERGEESDLNFIDFHTVLIEIWRGAPAEAALIAEDAMERALQLNGDLPLSVALTTRAVLGAYTGRESEVRRDVNEALAASERCGSHRLREWPITALGFLEVSLGNYQAAVDALQPLLAMLDAVPESTEIIAASYVPDAAEAMIQLGRLTDAEPLVEALERNGSRLDRPWMLAVGARCRAMLLAARGDVDAAVLSAQHAMAEHGRLPMPFERARTLLLLGQIQRRLRKKDAAAASTREALKVFEELDTPLWAERARAELARANIGRRRTGILTPSEQRVADLAASGMTNRDVAAALFISPKTVEANLARIYHKLGIRSRAELGRHVGGHRA